MILEKEYFRERAVMYARKYALVRNPLFFSFAGIGGNCTNFVSQCILAGSCVMNFTPIYGWYYLSTNRRSASWTGVQYFYNFMTQNTDVGPYGIEVGLDQAEVGDVIQLQNADGVFYHTIIISEIRNGEFYICANSNDALDKPLSEYDYANLRVIHILAVRYDTRFQIECFDSLYSPPLPPVESAPETPSEQDEQNAQNEQEITPEPQGEEAPQNEPQAEGENAQGNEGADAQNAEENQA